MFRKRNLWSVAGLLVLLSMTLAALAACGGSSSGGNGGGNPVSGGTITDAISQEPNSLLPERSNQTYSQLVDAAIRTPLFATNDQAGISPLLATEVPTTA